MKIKVALIGISGYGKVHFQHVCRLVRENRAEISAAVVINPDQVPNELAVLREMGCAIYSGTDAMFADFSGKLDLVCIPTGIAFHEPMTLQALAAGANVLVEKPAAASRPTPSSVTAMLMPPERAVTSTSICPFPGLLRSPCFTAFSQ